MDLNIVYNEDCLIGMKKIPDKSIDMILCDLPYGATRNKWDSVIPLDELWLQYERIIKDNGAIVLTAQTPFDKVLGASNLKMLRYEWIWSKSKATGFLNARRMPLKNHENILVFYRKLPTYNPQGVVERVEIKKGSKRNSSNYGYFSSEYTSKAKNFPKSVLYYPSEQRTIHPTQKPVELFEYLINTYTKEEDVVLDNCIGSGTTAIACLNTNRSFIGFEQSEEYFDKCMERIEKHKKML